MSTLCPLEYCGCDVWNMRRGLGGAICRPSTPRPPPLQEPELDPKPILELPLEKLAQKLQADELSLESVLCSYLEEVMGWGQDTTLGLGLERGMSPVVGGQV